MNRVVVMSLVAASLVLSVSIAHADEWPQVGFDATGTGVNPNEQTITTVTASHWRTRWQHRPNDVRRYITNPLITDDLVYVGGEKLGGDGLPHPIVWAYSLENGALRWSKRLPCESMGDNIGLGRGLLVVGVFDCSEEFDGYVGREFMLDSEDGSRVARFYVHEPYTVTIAGDLAVVPDSNDTITVFDLASRTLRNLADYDRDHEWAPVPLAVVDGEAWLGYSGTPLFSEGIGVLYGTWAFGKPINNGPPTRSMTCPNAMHVGLCAIDLATGEVLWEKVFDYPPDPTDLEYNTPIVAGGMVYSEGDGVVRALDLHSGELIWETAVPDVPPSNNGKPRPIYANGVLFVWSYDPLRGADIVLGFDALTGDLVTRRPGTTMLGPLGGRQMAIANGRLVTSVPSIRVAVFDRP